MNVYLSPTPSLDRNISGSTHLGYINQRESSLGIPKPDWQNFETRADEFGSDIDFTRFSVLHIRTFYDIHISQKKKTKGTGETGKSW